MTTRPSLGSLTARALRDCAGFGPRAACGASCCRRQPEALPHAARGLRLAADHRAAVGDSPKMSRPAGLCSDSWDQVKAGTDEPASLGGLPLDRRQCRIIFFARGPREVGCKKNDRAMACRACVSPPASPEGGATAARSRGAIFCEAKGVKMRRQRRLLPPWREALGVGFRCDSALTPRLAAW